MRDERIAPPPPLVGRDVELARLRDALLDGCGVVIAGDAGIGKTSVARTLAAGAADDGVAIESVVATGASDDVPLAAVANLVPATVDHASPLATIRATVSELDVRHRDRPVLLLVDDAHRLDRASAALILYLTLHRRVRVLATVRTGETVPDDVTRLWRDAGCARVDLGPLAADDVRELVSRRLGGPIHRPTLQWLEDAARGNPLHLDELLRSARDSGGIAQVDGLWRRVGAVSPSPRLREIVAERLGRLDPDERRALALVSLAEPLAVEVLDALGALDAAGRLEARGLVVADPDDPTTVRTAHPLHGEVARAQLGAIEGRELRRLLASALPAGAPAVRRLLAAWALEDGRRDDPPLLVDGLVDALARLDPERAVRFGRAAIDAGAGPEAIVPFATALRSTGACTEAEHLLAAHEDEIRDTPLAAVYAFNRAMGLQWGMRRQDDALALLQRAAGWRSDNEWRATIRQIASTLLVTSGRLREGIAIAEPLVELAEVSDATRLRIAIVLGHALPLVGRPHDARDAVEGTLDRCRPGATVEWPYETTFAAIAAATGDGWTVAEDRLGDVRRRALADDAQERVAYAEMHLARLANLRGDGASAVRLASDAFERFSLMDPREHALTCLAEVVLGEVARSDGDAARTALDRARSLRGSWPTSLSSTHRLALAEAAVLGAEGDAVAAQRCALRAADEVGEALLYEAEALFEHVRLGGRGSAVERRLARLSTTAPDTIVGRWSRHVHAQRSGSALESVAASWAEVGALGWAIEAAVAAAAAHAARGDDAAAERAASRAARLAAERGRPLDASAQAARTLAALRPREREVARLVARRLTNAEIAQRLSLSVRTVESHVYRATARLGVRSRAELAAAVADSVQ
jgi:DNA-binding CsgD family transcriptional regulator/type II secretory pathway predicted ATPase ExeA